MIGRPSQGVGIKCTYAHPTFYFFHLPISNILVILIFSTHTLFDSNRYLSLVYRLGRNLSLRIIECVLLFIETLGKVCKAM